MMTDDYWRAKREIERLDAWLRDNRRGEAADQFRQRGNNLMEKTIARETRNCLVWQNAIEALCDNGRRVPNPIAIRAIQGWIAESERILASTRECLAANS
jgi:hypothetical protein